MEGVREFRVRVDLFGRPVRFVAKPCVDELSAVQVGARPNPTDPATPCPQNGPPLNASTTGPGSYNLTALSPANR